MLSLRAGAAEAEYGDERAVRRIARVLTETPTSQDAKEFLAFRSWVRLARDQEFLDLRHGVGVATSKQWALVVVQPVVIRELAFRNGAADEFCQGLVPVIRRHLPRPIWSHFDRVELVYALEENNIVLGAASLSATPPGRIGTAEERSRLFEDLVQWTLKREAFSPPKIRRLGLDFAHDAQELRGSFLSASTENDLLLALTRLSNLRRDGHLTVVAEGPRSRGSLFLRAPIRFAVDYAEPGRRLLFVRDLGAELKDRVPELGDELISINGNPVAEYFRQMKPYFAASTDNRLWLEFAVNLSTKRHDFDPKLYQEDVTYELRTADGEMYTVTVPYLNPTAIRWRGDSVADVEEIPAAKPHVIDWTGWARKKVYPGFRKELSAKSFVVYLAEDLKLGVVLLDWQSFFRETFDSDVDLLMRVAAERGWLDRHVICDLTTSRGGQRSWYLLQKLASKPFRVTYGNLRISDISEEFVRYWLARYGNDPDATWFIDWLREDVTKAIQEKRDYTPAVPFKLSALEKDSNGILAPANQRFRGKLVCLIGPLGRSQVDQFAAMVIDNNLGHTIGMSTAGTSNTWELKQTLHLGRDPMPLATFMWTIGHTIRPNDEVLEGNPAIPAEFVPLTRENYRSYNGTLLQHDLRYLAK